jgi:hypothetical protein
VCSHLDFADKADIAILREHVFFNDGHVLVSDGDDVLGGAERHNAAGHGGHLEAARLPALDAELEADGGLEADHVFRPAPQQVEAGDHRTHQTAAVHARPEADAQVPAGAQSVDVELEGLRVEDGVVALAAQLAELFQVPRVLVDDVAGARHQDLHAVLHLFSWLGRRCPQICAQTLRIFYH